MGVVQPDVWLSVALHKPVREIPNAVFAELAANASRLIGAKLAPLSPVGPDLPHMLLHWMYEVK